MAETININGFEMDAKLYYELTSKYNGNTSVQDFNRMQRNYRLYFKGDVAKTPSKSLFDLYKDRISAETTSPNFTSRGLPEIFLEENILKSSKEFNNVFNPGADALITTRRLSEEESKNFWLCASKGYYNSGSNVEPTLQVNFEAMERSIDADLAKYPGETTPEQDYCIPGGFIGLSLLLTTAPHKLIAKSEKLINHSIDSLINRGRNEISKYGENSQERTELIKFAEKLRTIKQTYALTIANQKALDKENENAFNM